MIELKNVFLAYNKEYYALYDICLKFKKGDKVAIVGEEGSGKTALLRVIAGLENFKKGEAYINDVPLKKVDFEHDVSLGFISSKPVFFENKTILKNLEYVLKIRGVDKSLWPKQIEEALNKFGIKNLENEKVGTLCRSDRRIVQIARLSLRPLDILLCDDLDFNVEPKTNEKVKNALRILLENENEDKIFIVACTSAEYVKDFVNKTIVINSGSIEGKKIDK